ncbi:MAG: hypothetical protein ACI8S6_001651 [Myxococcota bacterium]
MTILTPQPCAPPRRCQRVSFSVVATASARCLHLHPCSRDQLAGSLGLPDDDLGLIVFPDGQIASMPWGRVCLAPPEAELVHLAPDRVLPAADQLPVPLLLDLDRALLPGSRAAISASEDGHAVIVSGDEAVLRAALGVVLGQLGALPRLPEWLQDTLLAADDWEHHHDVTLNRHQRFWTLEISRRGPDGLRSTRLVCEGAGGRWRTGWAW